MAAQRRTVALVAGGFGAFDAASCRVVNVVDIEDIYQHRNQQVSDMEAFVDFLKSQVVTCWKVLVKSSIRAFFWANMPTQPFSDATAPDYRRAPAANVIMLKAACTEARHHVHKEVMFSRVPILVVLLPTWNNDWTRIQSWNRLKCNFSMSKPSFFHGSDLGLSSCFHP